MWATCSPSILHNIRQQCPIFFIEEQLVTVLISGNRSVSLGSLEKTFLLNADELFKTTDIVEQSTVEQSSEEQSSEEQSTVEQSTVEQSTLERSSLEQSTLEQSTLEQFTVEHSTLE